MERRNGGKSPARTQQPGSTYLSVRPMLTRPLSEIREITEPSLLEAGDKKQDKDTYHLGSPPNGSSTRHELSAQSPSIRPPPLRIGARKLQRSPLRREITQDEPSSIFNVPPSSVPPRSSSRHATKRSISIPRAPAVILPTPRAPFRCIRNAGQTQSPVREVAERLDPFFDHGRVPSKTIVKIENFNATDILDNPMHYHHRIKMELLIVAPLFVGGSTVEGTIRLVIDEAERTRNRKTLTMERLQIDLIGVEEVSGGRRHVFIDLGNELVDAAHAPPEDMIESQHTLLPQERSWMLIPCVRELPFMLRLPLEVGPPSFQSRHARIRYVLCATLHINDGGRPLSVRTSLPTEILSVYDPEKALVSLPSPLTVTETCHLGPGREVTATAGLHRQVWISGTNILADVHIVNNSNKTLKKLEMQLERRVLCYKHAAAATLEMSASQARIFDQDERLVVSRTVIKSGVQGWIPVSPQSSVLRTCVLELPRDQATIKCAVGGLKVMLSAHSSLTIPDKYFEVRYFLNLILPTSHMTSSVQLQLPVILIHMNSLDVPTNSVAQVAAAIEERRNVRAGGRERSSSQPGRRLPKVLQGRAFNAPRTQSIDRQRQMEKDFEMTHDLTLSPRRTPVHRRRRSGSMAFKTPPSNRKGRVFEDKTADEFRRQFGRGHVRNVSHSSNVTNKSTSALKATPHADTSALRFYLQHADDKPYATSYAGSEKPASLASSREVKPPIWMDDRWRPHRKGHRQSRSLV